MEKAGQGLNSQAQATHVYTDFSGFSALKAQAKANDPKALREVAKQFEAIFLQMVVKSMRDANEALAEDPYGSNETSFYQEMFDQQLTLTLSEGKGVGLADMMVKQLSPSLQAPVTSVPTAEANSIKANKSVNNIQSFMHPKVSAQGHSNLDAAPTLKQFKETTKTEVDEQPSLLGLLGMTGLLGTHERQGLAGITPGTAEIQRNAGGSQLGMHVVARVDANGAPAVSNKPKFNSPHEFVKELLPHAAAAAQELQVHPHVLLAQAALETGWGKAILHHSDGKNSHNLFNIKANTSWDGQRVHKNAVEFKDGMAQKVPSAFRSYSSYLDSFKDYVNFLKSNPRYHHALKNAEIPHQFTAALSEAGYATDPNYATKLHQIMNSATLKDALKLSLG